MRFLGDHVLTNVLVTAAIAIAPVLLLASRIDDGHAPFVHTVF